MRVSAKLGSYAVLLVVVLAGGAAVGTAVRPGVDGEAARRPIRWTPPRRPS